MKLKVGEELVLDIKDWAPPQGAVGFAHGIAVFVPYVIPGELVKVRLIQRKKNWAIGVPMEIRKPSTWRQSPPCAHFGICGGCDYQMMDYEHQLLVKKEMLIKQARRAGVATEVLTEFSQEGIHPSPKPLGYRKRVRGVIQQGKFHLRQKNSSTYVRIDTCLLLHPLVNQAIAETCLGLPDGQYEWDLLSSTSRSFNQIKPQTEKQRVEELPQKNQVSIRYWPPSGEAQVGIRAYRSVKDLSFTQINPEVNECVMKELRRLIEFIVPQTQSSHLTVLELYAGSGNLTSVIVASKDQTRDGCDLSSVSIRVTAVEENFESVQLGRSRFSESLVRWIHSPVAKWLKGDQAKREIFDLLVVDPPRAGVDTSVIQFIKEAKRLTWFIYMSCDVMTWARDVRQLQDFYEVIGLHAFDMFPQTHHLEILSLLRRKSEV